ncbi:hypothetical protein J7E97_14630 [Streptomyces sp. ISL-66]|uniref:hypothetical protein n=1 Tax=Streptomyces sp. ISL-66 TaxID=2819186 RepID=UPI001BEB2E9E|nr:hypothetical protein [Streptomyces sp. ISL-66]MBT2469070.1 hypothetical protein [Streptomyces sp. ISL-66]
MNVAQELFRLAELAARTGLEPKLGQRFDRDPAGVLLEFGLEAQAWDWAAGATLSIDDLSTDAYAPADICVHPCICSAGQMADVQVVA